jgi:DNA-binding transcriptional LysR family regulator
MSRRPWPYVLADGTQLPTSGRFVTDDSGSIREAVIRGVGIAYLLHVTVAQDLAEGRLVELLPELIAIRMGSLADSDLVSRKIGDIRFVLAASPGYISRKSVPADLEDLGNR